MSDSGFQSWPKWSAGLLWLLALGACAAQLFRHRAFFHDDAYISLRYAANFLEFGELTWNRGEFVEGYTNLLHLLAVSVFGYLGLGLVDASRLVNLLSALALVAAFVAASMNFLERPDATAIALGAVAVFLGPAIPIWILGGLEAPMVAALVLWGYAFLLPLMRPHSASPVRSALLAGLAFALALLTRLDSVVLSAPTGLALLLFSPRPVRERLQLACWLALGPVLALLAVTAWRLDYYGDWLPNTFYAKMGAPLEARFESALAYLIKSVLWAPVLALAGLAYFCRWRTGWSRARDPAFRLILLAGAVQLLYLLWVGGDHMPAARMLVPAIPLAGLLLAGSLSELGAHKWLRNGMLAVLVMACLSAFAMKPRRMDPAAFQGTMVGRYISSSWPAGSLVAVHTAGSTPFWAAELRFVDMLGLVDRQIARRKITEILVPWQAVPGHLKGDGAYILSREPDYIIAGPAQGTEVEDPWFLSDVELARSPEFRRCYALRKVRLPEDMEFATRSGFNPMIHKPGQRDPWLMVYYQRTCAKSSGR